LSFNISNGNVQLIITITNKFIYVVASTYIALFDLLSSVFSAYIPVTKRPTTKQLEAEDSAAAHKQQEAEVPVGNVRTLPPCLHRQLCNRGRVLRQDPSSLYL
jgi:hypothetical protein